MMHNKETFIAAIYDRVVVNLKASAYQDFHFFLTTYYSKIPFERLIKLSLEEHAKTLLEQWTFFNERPKANPKIQVYFRQSENTSVHTSDRVIINMINDDRPFIVGSLLGLLSRLGVMPYQIVHPIFKVKRNAQGHFMSFESKDESGQHIKNESFIHCEIVESATHELVKQIQQQLPEVLQDVILATDDWASLKKKIDVTRQDLSQHIKYMVRDEWKELDLFLEWLQTDHFTFLGYAYFDLYDTQQKLQRDPQVSETLGILRIKERCQLDKIFKGIVHGQSTRRLLFNSDPFLINKTTYISHVHRAVPMDVLGIKFFDDKGQVKGVHLFVGLFTSIAYDSSARDIPFLRRRIDQVLKAADLTSDCHDGKGLVHILDSLPRDELFQSSIADLKKIGLEILELQEHPRVALFVRTDIFNRYLSCLVYIPSKQFNSELVGQIGDILAQELQGAVSLTKAHVGSLDFARVHYTINLQDGKIPPYQLKIIEEKLIDIARSWQEDLRTCLQEKLDEWHSARLYRLYRQAFNKSYQERYDSLAAIEDITNCEEVFKTNHYAIRLSVHPQEKNAVAFKLYHPEKPIVLSDILPTLENLGFKVISEISFKVRAEGAPYIVWIHDFLLLYEGLESLDTQQWQDALLKTILKIRDKCIDDDAFNKLVLKAQLTYRQVEVIRAYGKYLRQLDIPFEQETIQAALLNHPAITHAIVQLFEKKFDSLHPFEDKKIVQEIKQALNKVQSPDDDRILRRYMNLVHATVRTNYFQLTPENHPKPYLSFKFDGRILDDIPLPKPLYEIFIYSPTVEAVHLRGGKVARGGIRWSDRFEDFRTEILGLLKAQMVKNAVIVPVGSKGGFVVKTITPGMSREEIRARGIEGYQLMIQGMLDITDNLVNGQLVPAQTARWDEDDPYLVVAADKGTATFSDYANRISMENHFWLDDAFASGGSDGYDHKKMGITAKGAWKAVERHFYEMGMNPAIDPITVVGIGDMSGDVFGNGLLRSHSICLLFAFNHLSIFIDPNPDPVKSYAERERLFHLPQSNWSDYDASLISEGGGVFSRSTKSIFLSPQVKALLKTDVDSFTPDELIKAFLKIPVDLLWFGGIGTFIKATSQSHSDVGDRSNDALRVNGKEIQARVIAEGANLGVTHLGRIEYVKATGGRLNTDAIDNSAGVDCSDHEVNIKILLNAAVSKGLLSRQDRNQLLIQMTDDVAHLVLKDNYLQNLCISLMQSSGPGVLDEHIRLIRDLEKRGKLNRALEFLPDDVTLLDMQSAQTGLTRPELSVVMAYGKIFLYEELLKGIFIDDPFLHTVLLTYFPNVLQEQFYEEIIHHPLKREIIATSLANQIINRMGASYIHDLMERTGASIDTIVKAYWIVTNVLRIPQLWQELETYDHHIDNTQQLRIYLDLMRLVRRASIWLIRQINLDTPLQPVFERLDTGVIFYLRDLELFLNHEAREVFKATTEMYKAIGVEEGYAIRLATLRMASESPDILLIGEKTQTKVPEVAKLYFIIISRFQFSYLKIQLESLYAPNLWLRQVISGLIEDIYGIQSRAVLSVVAYAKHENYSLEKDHPFDRWLKSYENLVKRYDHVLNEAKATGLNDIMVFVSLVREIRLLFDGVKI